MNFTDIQNFSPSPIYVYLMAIAFIIAAILSGFFNIWISKKNFEKNSRLSYISSLLSQKQITESLSQLITEINLKKTNRPSQMSKQDLLIEINKSWCILFFALSRFVSIS